MKKRILLYFFVGNCMICSCFQKTAEVYIASGAGYRLPVNEIIKAFESKYNIKVYCIYGNMKQITSQTAKTKKVSVIVGDERYLNKSGLQFKEAKPMGKGKLILVYHRDLPLTKIEDLLQNTVNRILIPDSKKTIYGKAAHEALKNTGLLDKIGKKIITVQTVPQVSSYLASGTAKAGFINMIDYRNLDNTVFSYIEIDHKLYSEIIIQCRTTKNTTEEGNTLYRFMTGKTAKAILNKYGMGD